MDTISTEANSDTTPPQGKKELLVSETDLLAELAKDWEDTQIQPGEITCRMFADYRNIPIDTAKNFLMTQFEAKKIHRRMIILEGKRTWAYFKPSV